jgi:hypothetical protein
MTMKPGGTALVAWSNFRQTKPRPELAGTVYLFARAATCTVAQACEPQLVATSNDQPTTVDAQTERHAVQVTFPDRTRAYFVVVGGLPGPDGIGEFFQINPKTTDIQP